MIWVESDATYWVKTHIRYQRHISLGEPLTQKDVSEAWRATQVASNPKTRNLFTTKQVKYNLPSGCSCTASWVYLHRSKTSFLKLYLMSRLQFLGQSISQNHNPKIYGLTPFQLLPILQAYKLTRRTPRLLTHR